ncbi:MAG: D-alanine--D-alanine ligase [Gammaproteobacteria bacterium]
MQIGLTYDLREDYLALGYSDEETAEFDRPDTIEAIEQALLELGHQTVRIGHIQALTQRLAAGERWELVFNIAEGLHGYGREAQVPALLDAYGIAYTFSDPLVSALTLHKGLTKHVVRGHGIATPDFALVASPDDLEQIDLPYPLFAKPVAEGTSKGVDTTSRIREPGQLREVCQYLLERFRQPVLVETYLPGREFTVGILGTGAAARPVAVMEVTLQKDADAGIYTYRNKAQFETLVQYRLAHDDDAEQAKTTALAAWQALGCRDGGRVDVRLDAQGKAQFIEVNPLAGLHPGHSDLPIMCTLAGIPYRDLIQAIVNSASSRCPAQNMAVAA